jgi:hypothetical protein
MKKRVKYSSRVRLYIPDLSLTRILGLINDLVSSNSVIRDELRRIVRRDLQKGLRMVELDYQPC